ncbi:MAG: type III secretion HpaP family protein [bacterium]
MDTHVPAIETGEDTTAPHEDSLSRLGTPENSDVALFKQKIAQPNSALMANVSASQLNTGAEQTEELIDLSHKFKDLLNPTIPVVDKKTSTLHQVPPHPDKTTLSKTDIALNKSSTQMGKTDIALFEQKIAQPNSVLTANISASQLNTGVEQTEGLIDLLHKGKTDINVIPSTPKDAVESKPSIDPLKKETTPIQDNPYVTPLGTSLISQPATIQNTGSIETHATMISQQIKDQVIDRILVSTNDLAANKMVKVVINPNVLQGTEVNFQKVGDMLSVQFLSRNESSLQFLQVNQADLQGYLQNELKQFKGVSVSVKPNGNSAEQPEDGRSRNRYEYQALDEDEQ